MTAAHIIFEIVFYLAGVSAILFSLLVVMTAQPVKGVLFLILTFIAMAVVWILLNAEFLALILVVVYIGAVMTLFLFVVMMMNFLLPKFKLTYQHALYCLSGLAFLGLILAMLLIELSRATPLSVYPVPLPQPADFSNVAELGMSLYSSYLYPFLVAGVVLLVAMIAAITLAFRGQQKRRTVDVAAQLAADPKRRVRMMTLKGDS